MKVAVTGAYSYSGKYITRRLLKRGDELITLTNHPNRMDPFNRVVKPYPLDFSDPESLRSSLVGVEVLVNTYWIRFDRGWNTQSEAVANTKSLITAALEAGVKKIIHISITNPSPNSRLPYFSGKAANEQTVIDSGLNYAILRPTVLFGREDILINNIAWLVRRFLFFPIPGDGSYRLQPVYVGDLAELVGKVIAEKDNLIWDAVGPDIFTFRGLVELIGETISHPRPSLPTPPFLALLAAQLIGLWVGDVMLTSQELNGLMASLLVSRDPPRCHTRLSDWLMENRKIVGMEYASELSRHY